MSQADASTDNKQFYERVISPYSCALTQVYFWSFISLTIYFLRRLKTAKSKLEVVVKVSIICFGIVICLQAISELYTLIRTREQVGTYDDAESQISRTINIFGELFSTLILYHFVLELQPVIIALRMAEFTDIDEQTRALKSYKILYYSTMIISSITNLTLLTSRTLTRYNQDEQSYQITTLSFIAGSLKFCEDLFITWFFIHSAITIRKLKKGYLGDEY